MIEALQIRFNQSLRYHIYCRSWAFLDRKLAAQTSRTGANARYKSANLRRDLRGHTAHGTTLIARKTQENFNHKKVEYFLIKENQHLVI
jgi:hypothetical protein